MTHDTCNTPGSGAARRGQRGFSLVEVLVAVVVLSIGLLGLGALQATGINNTNNAYFRSQATLIANALVERMRANPKGFDDGAYSAIDSNAINCNAPPNPYCAQRSGAAAADCNTGQLAAFDIWTAVCGMDDGAGNRDGGLKALLPAARLTVNCPAPCGKGAAHALKIAWGESRKGAAMNRSVTMVFQK